MFPKVTLIFVTFEMNKDKPASPFSHRNKKPIAEFAWLTPAAENEI